MRPVRLTVQAFGPFAGREVIDFRAALESGLFGIFGQTGSGKSTLFSAMTFALFGKSAKSEQDAPTLRSDMAEDGTQTEVEFVFDLGAQRFVVLRRPEQMRPKSRGEGWTRSPHDAALFDATGLAPDEITDKHRGKIIAEKKVSLVDAAITDMLGYGLDQFRQIVLLPQGRFEAFLSAQTRARLDILRDLFDVSSYRALAAHLKAQADTTERTLREQRAVCAQRLAAEGFESTDALTAGIDAATAHHAALVQAETQARAALAAVQGRLQAAEALAKQFQAADVAQAVLDSLLAEQDRYHTLAERVRQAGRAELLQAPEQQVVDAATELRNAESDCATAQAALDSAQAAANAALDRFATEQARAGELDALRKQIDTLDRYSLTLAAAADKSAAVETALDAERSAKHQVSEAEKKLTALRARRRAQADALDAARTASTARIHIAAQLSSLNAALASARDFEAAEADLRSASKQVITLRAVCQETATTADTARRDLAQAEQALAHVQALHLASRLERDAACPVCGSHDHPAPATGEAEHVGRDQAFRDAKAAWERADRAARAANQKLSAAESLQAERRRRLDSIVPPAEGAASLRAQAQTAQAELDALGLEMDLTAAAAKITQLDAQIHAQEEALNFLRDRCAKLYAQTATRTAQRDDMLSSIPQALRDPAAISAAQDRASRELDKLQAALAATQHAAKESREAALAAAKDHEAAERARELWQHRHARASDSFRAQLHREGLSEADYRAPRPAIATIAEDRARLDAYQSKLAVAKDADRQSRSAIDGQNAPDLNALTALCRAADDQLAQVTNQRARVGHKCDQLTALRDELATTLDRLDADEVASGPLRGLAAMVNGDNAQNLDLETFAIGAMFDQVLGAANLRLAPMTSGRYRLERALEGTGRGRRGLGIQVFDLHSGRARATATLSGGETFIAALALALGLADVVESASGKVRLDTIFIDEGFGSLDTENGSGTLEQVLRVLNTLVSQNRAVGLISHVPLVQDEIPNGFYVRKEPSGSRVETRGPGLASFRR